MKNYIDGKCGRRLLSKLALAATAIAAVALSSHSAKAQLVLTPAGAAQGFTISTFASGFPSVPSSSGNVGPLGIAFEPGGRVLVTDDPGNVRLFATDTDGQIASSASPITAYGQGNAIGLTTLGGNTYMTQQTANTVVQITNNGASIVQTIVPFTFASGIVADPTHGNLLVDNSLVGGGIITVDPVLKTSTPFVATGQFDGLTLDATHNVVYAANLTTQSIQGFNLTTKALVFDSGSIAGGVDGVGVGSGVLAGLLVVNTNGGTLVEVNIATHAQTLIANGGSRGDFVATDPNGSLLITQSNSIQRLSGPAGGGFGGSPATPEVGTWLMGAGLFAMLGFEMTRRKPAVKSAGGPQAALS